MGQAADILGNPVSTADASALAGVDDFVGGLLTYETRAANILGAAAESDHTLVNAYAATLFMLLESPAGPVRARPFLERARAAPGANARELAFIAFLDAWTRDDIPGALSLSAAIVDRWPRDLVAVKLHQYLAFGHGDAATMLRIAQTAAPACADVPQIHGMVAFAFEQLHRLDDAEAAAGRALAMTDREPWAQHALAHVMLTQGRIDEGARFMEGAAGAWTGLNSFMVSHNWWHLALFYLSQGRVAEMLAAYDTHIWAHDRDYSQDQINAVSLLARLELAGFEVGDRWTELAGRLAARGPDVEQPFLSLQYLYGLARAGRAEAEPMMDAIRRRAREAPSFSRPVWAGVALPIAEGVLAFLRGRPDEALDHMDRAMPDLARIGGSHAQRDLFDQVRLAALMDAGRWPEARRVLESRRAHDPHGVPLTRALARAIAAAPAP